MISFNAFQWFSIGFHARKPPDQDPDEQGIAHMMEHVCFLGSRKRERLLGTGSRSNALTDFQPLSLKNTT